MLGSSLAADLLQPKTTIGPYTITGLIAFGMMGGLYRGLVRSERRAVSLWVLPSVAAADPEVRKRLVKAATKLASLGHPVLLKVNRVEWSDGRCCIEMEAVEGQTLEQWLLDETQEPELPGVMQLERARKLLDAIAGAMGECHSKEVYHFNLVPSSILILDDGSIKLAGFGLVQQLDNDLFQKLASASVPPVRTELKENTLLITDVRSPEVQAGVAPTRASDIFHFGSLAYFLLTGRRFQKNQPIAPTKQNPALAAAWDTLIGRCLCTDEQGRYGSMQQVAADLRALETLPAKGGLWGAAEHGIKNPKRKISITPGMAKALVGACTALVVAGVVAWITAGGGRVDAAYVRASTLQQANIVVQVSSTPARVDFSGAASGSIITKNGAVAVQAPPGSYVITVEAENHGAERMELNLEQDPVEVAVDLQPLYARTEIITQPFARVDVLGPEGAARFLGIADDEGRLLLDERLVAGEHIIQSRAEGYLQGRTHATLAASGNAPVEIPLEAAPAQVEVVAWPPGAEIWVNGKRIGRAPVEIPGVRIGEELLIEARAEGFRPRRVPHIAKAQGVIDLGKLEAEEATVSVRVGFADGLPRDGVRLLIDGEETAIGKKAILGSGEHVVRAEHPDFEVAERMLDLADRERIDLELVLEPKPAKLFLNVPTAMQELSIHVDGQPVSGEEQIHLRPGREVEVAILTKDHLTVRRRLLPHPNEEIHWDVQLVPIPAPEIGQDWTIPYLNAPMVWLDAGSFRMGSPRGEQENRPNEGPITEAAFTSGFWVGTYEVTQQIYQQVMGKTRSAQEETDLPVVNVSWEDAVEFCRRVTEAEQIAGRLPPGYEYRLPSEAEWEYAARAGTVTPFSFGAVATPQKANLQGRYPRDHSVPPPEARYGLAPVGSYAPNAWGLYDMHGNASEWCVNLFNSRYPGATVIDWSGPASGRDRPIRGGSWGEYADRCRSAARERLDPKARSAEVGFRLVLAPKL